MKERKEYRVIYPFRDLQDIGEDFPNGRIYAIGDVYTNEDVSPERLEELSTKYNRMSRPLIKAIEIVKVVEEEEEDIEPEVIMDFSDYNELTVAELKDLAKAMDLSGYSNMNKPELIELLEGD